jgi:hypothetical protein
MSLSGPNPRADKRKAAIERLRKEERKDGVSDDTEHTFKHQINDRSSYLEGNKNDSLDVLANGNQEYSNDIMEQPLPGTKQNQSLPNNQNNQNDGFSKWVRNDNGQNNSQHSWRNVDHINTNSNSNMQPSKSEKRERDQFAESRHPKKLKVSYIMQ